MDLSNPKVYKASVKLSNFEDIISFAHALSDLKVFQNLSYNEKLKILFSYSFKFEIYSQNCLNASNSLSN